MSRFRFTLFHAGFLIGAALLAYPTSAAEPLRWNFTPGESHSYRVTQKTTLKLDAGLPGEINAVTQQITDLTWRVLESEADQPIRIRCEVLRIQLQSESASGEIVFDSASDEPPQGLAAMIAPSYRNLLELGFEATITRQGKIIEVFLPEDLTETLKNVPGGGATAINESALHQLLQATLVEVVDIDLEQGEEWSSASVVNLPMFGRHTIRTTYRYQEDREVDSQAMAVLTPEIAFTTEDDQPTPPTAAITQVANTGEILFNRQAGRLDRSEVQQQMLISMMVKGESYQGDVEQQIKVESIAPGE